MSLLLKALKQAETVAQAGKTAPDALPGKSVRGELELEPVSPPLSDAASEWVEPPGLLFGSNGLPPAQPRSRTLRLPRLSLVPTVALMAVIVALGYGIYLYFALQPSALPPPAVAVAPTQPGPELPTPPGQPVPPRQPVATARPPETVITLPPVVAVAPQSDRNIAARPARTAVPPATPAEIQFPSAVPVFRPDAHATLLSNAHAAYQAGQLDEAQRLYSQAAANTRSTDALLGLAAIAVAQNREQDAVQRYREILEFEPRNATAQAALLDLMGSTDSQASESRLKSLIDRDPSPHLYQTLGTLYAEQQRWPEAQAAFFEAYRGAPGNADYAYNLAVSLDMLKQRAAALTYYEKALALGGAHRFDRSQAETRIRQLKATL